MRIPFLMMTNEVAIQERKELIARVIAAASQSVVFEHGVTKCPVCLLIGICTYLRVQSTQDEIRYCICPECCATVKAIGAVKTPEPLPEAGLAYNNSNKKGKRNGNLRATKS